MRHGLIVDRIRAKSWRDGAGREIFADRGWRLTVLTDRPGHGHANPGPHTEVIVVLELTDASIRDAVVAIHRARPLSAISTTSELYLDVIAAMRDATGIPGPGIRYTETLRDKWTMKRIARDCGLPHAEGVLGTDLAAAADLLLRASRCVVKPRRLSGSRGVRIVDNHAQLRAWFEACEDPASYIIEEFVAGALLHIDGVVEGSRATWQLSRYERPTHLAGGPTPLSSCTVDDPIWLDRAGDFADRVVRGWGMQDEVFHVELFAAEHGPVFCEVAGRPGGAGVSPVFAATRGIDLRHAKTYLDFGEPVLRTEDPRALHPAGGWSVFYAQGGRFRRVADDGLDLHHTREIRARLGERLGGRAFSGVGVATYTFLGKDSASVRSAIRRYEREVRILEDPDGADEWV
jgi:hypothetical protein